MDKHLISFLVGVGVVVGGILTSIIYMVVYKRKERK